MKLKYTTPKEIEKMIKTLKCKTSLGYDAIPMQILKVSTTFITPPLTYMCNKSLLSGVFPFQLKFSEIKPLYKIGDRMDITNFRPIYLLKILEKVIHTRLYQHINQNDILATEQYGFKNNPSTEIASFKLINEILLALNNKITVGGIFCDL